MPGGAADVPRPIVVSPVRVQRTPHADQSSRAAADGWGLDDPVHSIDRCDAFVHTDRHLKSSFDVLSSDNQLVGSQGILKHPLKM